MASMETAFTARGGVRAASRSSSVATAHTGRIAILASADRELRGRIAETLAGLRWDVRQAAGGAELFAMMEGERPLAGTVLLDSWLPDLDVQECVRELALLYPDMDVLALDGTDIGAAPAAGPYRNEVLHALRLSQQSEEAVWVKARSEAEILGAQAVRTEGDRNEGAGGAHQPPDARQGANGVYGGSHHASQVKSQVKSQVSARPESQSATAVRTASILPLPPSAAARSNAPSQVLSTTLHVALPELLGTDPRMLEVSRRIRLVAPRPTAVLVQGPTGTGKELVARALHRLSPRSARPFIVLNCAAIPEALLEAELFGHTRGAFTGAVQGRTGRLEAAHGGSLFLDEIGELPLALQAKLLRFVECGELQRVGENEPVRVDVRIIAATHRKLGQMAAAGTFRADLYYRLSVFLIKTPALAERAGDIALLAHNVVARMGRTEPAKALTAAAMMRLVAHSWPGNVRELEHTIERAWILAADSPRIEAGDIDFAEELEDGSEE